jgi:hypothetical protein
MYICILKEQLLTGRMSCFANEHPLLCMKVPMPVSKERAKHILGNHVLSHCDCFSKILYLYLNVKACCVMFYFARECSM